MNGPADVGDYQRFAALPGCEDDHVPAAAGHGHDGLASAVSRPALDARTALDQHVMTR